MSIKIITNAISAVLALGVTGMTTNATAQPQATMVHSQVNIEGMEKCYGIAKAGRNDCGTSVHNCAGEAKMDRDAAEWLLTPTGLCDRIAGAQMKAPEKV